jgi:hypothetical protein
MTTVHFGRTAVWEHRSARVERILEGATTVVLTGALVWILLVLPGWWGTLAWGVAGLLLARELLERFLDVVDPR